MQFLWTDFGDHHISWRDIIFHFYMHSRFSSVCIFYWQHAGMYCMLVYVLGETLFCIFTCILCFPLLKTYLQSMTVRLEEWRIKKRDTEQWMRHRQLPLDLQERVLRFVQYKWLATRGVKEESILLSLPLDLRREIQRHLCLALVRRVCLFWPFSFYVHLSLQMVQFCFLGKHFMNSYSVIAGAILLTNG